MEKVNVSIQIVKHLQKKGIENVFGVIGSSMIRVFQGLGETEGIDYVCPLHEQGASMAAEAYARRTGKIGVALATCGPGATNTVTGCAGAYTDSIPVLYLIGHPNYNQLKKDLPIRFYAYQEFDLVRIFEPVTKYAVMVEKASDVLYEIDKAMDIALTGRKGPVMVAIPQDIIYSDICENEFKQYKIQTAVPHADQGVQNSQTAAKKTYELLKEARRPILLYGAGVNNAGGRDIAKKLAERMNCPIALTYPMRDMLDYNHPLNCQSVGIFGTRGGNFAIQGADLLICVGTRMDNMLTGTASEFGKRAKKVIIDIEQGELDKLDYFGYQFDGKYKCDAKLFLSELNKLISDGEFNFAPWMQRIREWHAKYPLITEKEYNEKTTNPYVFFEKLATQMNRKDDLVIGSGFACSWAGQSFKFLEGQRWIMQFAIGAMGYGLPAALGTSYGSDGRIIMVTGDGSVQMTIQEMATIKFYNRNVKIFIICNEAYGLIQKTQETYNVGHYATDREHHLPLPDTTALAKAYGYKTYDIYENAEIENILQQVLNDEGPVYCAVHVPVEKKMILQVRGSLENMVPALPEGTVEAEMAALGEL